MQSKLECHCDSNPQPYAAMQIKSDAKESFLHKIKSVPISTSSKLQIIFRLLLYFYFWISETKDKYHRNIIH